MITIRNIQQATANHFEIDLADILGPSRHKLFTRPRQIAMYLSRKMTDRSYPEIGRAFGGRDHTTIHHGEKKIAGLLDDEMKRDCARISEQAITLQQQQLVESGFMFRTRRNPPQFRTQRFQEDR